MKKFKKLIAFMFSASFVVLGACQKTPDGNVDSLTPGSVNVSDTVSSSSVEKSQSASKESVTSQTQSNINSVEPSIDTLAVVRITTSTGKDVTSKTQYISGTFEAIDENGTKAVSKTTIDIRGRGNTTWTFEKKAYRVKFGSATNPFNVGGGSEKSWILLANMCDHSVIRNQLGLSFCESLSNLDFTANFKPVELYLNGVYNGTYLLTEAVQVANSRVNITNSKNKEDTGYLIELTKNQTDPEAIMIKDTKNIPYEIKNDVSSSSSTLEKQKTYITNYLNSCWTAIDNQNETEIRNLIDIPSAVDAYIAEEVLNNMDVGWDSFYFVKDKNAKLKFGPLWDFDVSMGNGNDDSQYAQGFHALKGGFEQQNDWFIALMQMPWFRQEVQNRWKNITPELVALSQNVSKFSQSQRSANIRNFEKWSKIQDGKLVRINYENNNVLACVTYDEQINYLQNWIDTRISWLDENILSQDFLTKQL